MMVEYVNKNHAHKIFNNACSSYLKNNFIEINKNSTNTIHVLPKIKQHFITM
jgi:hypothetical protein